MEYNSRSETTTEMLDSDHLLHENRILRKVIREKDQRIADLEHQLELKIKYQSMLDIDNKVSCAPSGK